jgi:dihydroorotate dehydrogenase (NAD+) catalytic subunit
MNLANSSLECKLAGLNFPNPLILASGILGVAPSSMIRLGKIGIGGITTKTVGPRSRRGYGNPSIVEIDPGTLLNSVGLANPGIEAFIPEIKEIKANSSIPLIVSVFGNGPKEYAEIAQKAEKAGADAVEINVSCPHAEVASIGLDPILTKEFTETVKAAVNVPVFVKLTPNMFDMVPIAKAAEAGGADAIVAINTVRALALDIETGRPLLSHGIGGLSGKAVRPIGVRAVYEIFPKVKIPIIGCGGVSTWQDVLEYIYAGASAVQIGTALINGMDIVKDITNGLTHFLKNHNIPSISQLIGKAHQYTSQLEVFPKE